MDAQRLGDIFDEHTWLVTHLDCIQLELDVRSMEG
jgi:hypothetical protein